jgi:hypothetical protein
MHHFGTVQKLLLQTVTAEARIIEQVSPYRSSFAMVETLRGTYRASMCVLLLADRTNDDDD